MLVGLAANMVDRRDELFVIKNLNLTGPTFLKLLETYRRRVNLTVSKCSNDGATVATFRRKIDVLGRVVKGALQRKTRRGRPAGLFRA